MPIITKSVVINNNAPIGCPPGGTEDQILVKNSNLNFDYKWVDNNIRPYKVYTALLTQTGTNAPTATVLENTLGFDLNYTYDAAGNYTATTSDASEFNPLKTTLFIDNNLFTSFDTISLTYGSNPDELSIFATREGYSLTFMPQATLNNTIELVNGIIINTLIEIRVYP